MYLSSQSGVYSRDLKINRLLKDDSCPAFNLIEKGGVLLLTSVGEEILKPAG